MEGVTGESPLLIKVKPLCADVDFMGDSVGEQVAAGNIIKKPRL
jgi:hypothetical protein